MSTFYMFRSWFGALNFLLLQWFFIRLVSVVDSDTEEHIRWQLTGFIAPLSGWWMKWPYRFLGKRWRLERKEIVS